MDSFSITNFRIFDDEGVKIDFAPITILTGANSSGKSSYVKAMILLRDWLEELREDYKKDGTFMPGNHPMDFSRADLKLKGFNGTRNRNAADDARMTFAVDFNLGLPLGIYTVEYAFVPKDGILDMGILDSIKISIEGDERYLATRNGKSFRTASFKGFLDQFFMLECLHLIPDNLLNDFGNPYEGYCSEVLNEQNQLDFKKLDKTEEGSRLRTIQSAFIDNLEYSLWRFAFSPVQEKDSKRYPTLFGKDLTSQFEKFAQNGIFFYFPMLERFVGANKEESIRILKEEDCKCENSQYIFKYPASYLEKLINAFENSEFDSFIDFYKKEEHDFLTSFSSPYHINFRGKSENFIDQDLMPAINMEFNNIGSLIMSKPLFYDIYSMFSAWQWTNDEDSRKERTKNGANDGDNNSEATNSNTDWLYRSNDEWASSYKSGHWLYKAYMEFVSYIMEMIMKPDIMSRMTYFNNSFSGIQRLHSFEEGSLMVKTVRAFLDVKDKYNPIQDKMSMNHLGEYSSEEFMNKWLREYGIGNSLIVRVDDEGLGFKLFINKGTYEESLADMGHGTTQMVSILLLIETAIMESRILALEKKDQEEGYQVVSSLPPAILVIEEPEVSMHPDYQSKLTSLFEDAAMNYGVDINFVIETHSEYLVRKSQAIVAEYSDEQFDKNPFAVYYFTKEGQAYSLGYTKSGRFLKPFGEGFFDEAARLNYQVLKKEHGL